MENIDSTIEYIEQWLQIQSINQNAIPIVKKILIILKWKRDVLKTFPDNIKKKIPTIFISKESELNDYNSISNALPLSEPAKSKDLLYIFNTTVGSSSSIINPINTIEYLKSDTDSWAVMAFKSYQQVEEQIDAPAELRRLLIEIVPSLIDEYDLIDKNYYSSFSQLETRINTSVAMRVFLEHFKGFLFKKAMYTHEQKINWPIMADRICIGPISSLEHKILLNEEDNYKNIHLNLTDYFKNRIKCTEDAIKIERTKLIAHLYSIINLIIK